MVSVIQKGPKKIRHKHFKTKTVLVWNARVLERRERQTILLEDNQVARKTIYQQKKKESLILKSC